MGLKEFRYNQIARICGIDVPDFKLLQDKYFASRRFDLHDGQRWHVATASALLREPIAPPKMEYKTLLLLTGYLTQDASAVEQMYRRMVFNVLTGNKDDHAKNFSFLFDENKWHLAPAYDLTFSVGYNGEHATSVNGNGRPSADDMIRVGEAVRIPRTRAHELIVEITQGCQPIILEEYRTLG